jgi:sorbitol-6-phosphate 2-dehydrogenase
MQLIDKVSIITGGGQGLGEAIAVRMAQEGCKTVIADISAETAEKTAEKITEKYGKESFGISVDVTSEDHLNNMVVKTFEKFGKIDLLVSNAGILIAKELPEFPAREWRKVIDVNLTGYFLACQAVSRVMIKQKSGSIIQINSKSGKKGSYRNSAYAASKFGGIGLTQSLALELAEYNIRVNSICPGNLLDSPLWVDSLYEQYSKKWGISKEEVRKKYTDQVPLKRGCTYDDICNMVVFLASENSSYMTGQAINVTGGQEMR